MTIKKGEDWGGVGLVDPATPVAESDSDLAGTFEVMRGPDGDIELVGPELVVLLPNDTEPATPREANNGLTRTVGARGTSEQVLGQERTILPIDLGVVTIDPGSEQQQDVVVASSLVICGRFWSGVTEGAMNSAFLSDWNVTPSGHPNDGRFDVVKVELGISDRFKAKKRLVSGAHIPHPNISIRRLKEAEFRPPPSSQVWIDGRGYGRAAMVTLRVFPDAVSIAI